MTRIVIRIAVLTALWLIAGGLALFLLVKQDAPPARSPEVFLQMGHAGAAATVAWSPDGKVLATAGSDGALTLWDSHTGMMLRSIAAHSQPVRFASWSPDGKTLVSAGVDHSIKLWEPSRGTLLRTISTGSDMALFVGWSPDGLRLAGIVDAPGNGGEQGRAVIWEAATGKVLHTFGEASDFLHSVAWHPDGKRLATCGATVKLWQADTGALLATLPYQGVNWFHYAVWSPDGQTLGTVGPGKLRLWQMSAGYPFRDVTNQPADRTDASSYVAAAWSADGQRLAIGGTKVTLWQAATGTLQQSLAGSSQAYFSVAWSPDGHTVAGSSYEGLVRLWDAQTGAIQRVLPHASSIYALTWSPDGRTLASGSYDQTVKLWDPASGSLVRTIAPGIGVLHALVWSPDGQSLAGGGDQPDVPLWDARTGSVQRTLAGQSGPVKSLAWSPDSKAVAAAYTWGIRLWDAASGEVQRTLSTGASSDGNGGIQYIPAGAESVTWSADGLTLAAAHGTVDFFAATGKHLENFHGQPSSAQAVAFRPQGRTVAIACYEGQLSLWETGIDRTIPPGANFWFEPSMMTGGRGGRHPSEIEAVAWSRDGAMVATAHDDGAIQLWNGDTGLPLRSLTGHAGYVRAVAWSPDGRTLASGGEDGTIRIWDVATGELRSTTTLLPGDEWVTMPAKSLWYASSPRGDEYGAVRFDGRLLPLFPLNRYRAQLRRPDPLHAGGPSPDIRPDLMYLAPAAMREKRPWLWAWLVSYAVLLAAVLRFRIHAR